MENRHTNYDLAQMQSLPLQVKITMTENRIRQWYEVFDGDVYVSISGGKDSQVLAHLVKKLYPDVPLVTSNTGLEYDSVRNKALELADDVVRPEMNFVQVLTKYGYPVISKDVSDTVEGARRYIMTNGETGSLHRLKKLTGRALMKDGSPSIYNCKKYEPLLKAPFRISANCCKIMKKKPTEVYEKETGRKAFIGTLASESRFRAQKWKKYGCNAFEQQRETSQPLSFWTEQDILEYIELNGLSIANVYGDIVRNKKGLLETTGEKRTGCVFCLFGITKDKDRLIRLKENDPKKYDFLMRGGKFDEQGLWIPDKGLGYKFVIDWLNDNLNLDIRY